MTEKNRTLFFLSLSLMKEKRREERECLIDVKENNLRSKESLLRDRRQKERKREKNCKRANSDSCRFRFVTNQ